MKNRFRLLLIIVTALAVVLFPNMISFADIIKTVPVSYEGQILKSNALDYNGGETLFLPLRAVGETLGYSVEWSQEDRSVTVKDQSKTVLFEPEKNSITDAGHSYYVMGNYYDADSYYIGGGCVLISGRIYVASDLMESTFGIQKTYDPEAGRYVISIAPPGNVAAENRIIYSEDSRLLTNIQYPHITAADQAVTDKINAVILADVEAAKQETQDNLKNYESYQGPNKYETYFNYEITYQKENLLSLVLWDYQYYGGAHGSTRQISHTFDLKTGTEYALADMMDGDAGYVEYINDSIKAKIVEDGMKEVQLAEFVSIADQQSYYLSDDGLIIYFQQYEYFPYAAGIMEYDFPYADLDQYLKAEFRMD